MKQDPIRLDVTIEPRHVSHSRANQCGVRSDQGKVQEHDFVADVRGDHLEITGLSAQAGNLNRTFTWSSVIGRRLLGTRGNAARDKPHDR